MDQLPFVIKNYIHYIDNVIKNHKLSHAYLVEINDYEDDLKYVYDFIKMIFLDCEYDDLKNNDNQIINNIDNGSYVDFFIIEPDGNNIKKNQLLDLQKEFSNKSLLGGKRVYLIKNAEKFNASSANTILKFLEEPEENIVAILLTDNRYNVIDTIISRCQILNLKQNNFNIEIDDKLVYLLNCFKNPDDFFINYNYILNELLIDKNKGIEVFKLIENIFVQFLNCYYLNTNYFSDDIYSILKGISNKKIIRFLSIFEDEIPKLDYNVNFKLWLDCLFSRFILGG